MKYFLVVLVAFLLVPSPVSAAVTMTQVDGVLNGCIALTAEQRTCVAGHLPAALSVSSVQALATTCTISYTAAQASCITAKIQAQSQSTQTNTGSAQTTQPTQQYDGKALTEFKPIVPVPGITDAENLTFPQYINQLFKIALSLGGILAVLMIVLGGFEYMTSEVAGEKKDGAKRIRGAITGLILLLASYLILFVINPCLVEINVFTQGGGTDCSPPVQTSDTATNTREDSDDIYTHAGEGGCFLLSSSTTPPPDPLPACATGGGAAQVVCVPNNSQTDWRIPENGTPCTQQESVRLQCPCGTAQAQAGTPVDIDTLAVIPNAVSEGDCRAAGGEPQRFCCPIGSRDCLLQPSTGTVLESAQQCAADNNHFGTWLCAGTASSNSTNGNIQTIQVGGIRISTDTTDPTRRMIQYPGGACVGTPGMFTCSGATTRACVDSNNQSHARTGNTCPAGQTSADSCLSGCALVGN